MHCPVSLAAQVNWVGTLARQNWEYFLGFQSGMAVPLHEADISRQSARLERLRARTTQEDFLRFCDIFAASDLSETLGRVEAPTLVLHIPGQGFVSQEESSQTAALLRNGRLVVVPGAAFFGEPNAVVSAVEGLLAETASKSQATAVLATHALSPREIEVLRLLATGKSNQQIADALFISLNTVNRHVSNVYAKTGAANRAEAVTFAHHHGLAD
jgi:DNA-binding CsgD family transcriptional regulator